MGQQAGKSTNNKDATHEESTDTSCGRNIKVLRLPYGTRPDHYEEFGFPYLPLEADPRDDKLLVIRRNAPHATAKGCGLIALRSLKDSHLCAVCGGIEVLGLDCHFELVHLPLARLRNNSSTCKLCSFLYSALRKSYYANPSDAKYWLKDALSTPDGKSGVSSENESNRRDYAHTSVITWPQLEETSFHVFLGYGGPEAGSCIFRIFKQPAPSRDTQLDHISNAMVSKRKFEAIHAWLAEDVKNLGNLGMKFDRDQALPTRLLDVGTQEEAELSCSTGNHEKGSLHLIYTRDAQFGQIPILTDRPWKLHKFLNPNWIYYAVLSHRWGKSTEISSTTKANIRSRFNGISYSELCGTFKDAIVVARQLRIRYLWIDSLCIIQDDKDDWKKESAIMGDVYYKAFVTLFAHSYAQGPNQMSQSSRNGPKDPGLDDEVNTKDEPLEDGGSGFLDSALSDEQDPSIFIGSTTPTPGDDEQFLYAKRSRIFEEDIQNSGLTSRAWIVQERLLSPRIIHFFPSQLYYESHSNGPVRSEDKSMPPTFDKFRECIFDTQTRYGATPDVWFKVVERFSTCHLTQGSDKLLAIGGIAQKFHTESQVPYWAGLFADRAAKGLLWTRRGPKLLRVPDRAPSWSWASVDGPIRYSDALIERPFRVLPDVKIDYSFTTPLDEPKHLKGFDNVLFLLARGYMRNISISSEYVAFKDIVGYSHVPIHLPYELDVDDSYRKLLDDQGDTIGWVILDEDRGGELLELKYTSLIVASEEAWVRNPTAGLEEFYKKHPSSREAPLYRTHPPNQEFEAFAATKECQAEYERLKSNEDEVLPESSISRAAGERVLFKTYWVLILKPENASLDLYTPADEDDQLMIWKRVGMGLVFEKGWARKGDLSEFYFG
ncbi:heterokaryon incompatibility protein-domain-containing protein [Rhexocercosporidium sp. MPI-PUGE-AT-0058]|nr:heterokaryon incompatibility protein-domain-containing protein [Rhexocercosporidium sp. MPI-PUGE-AT-0058]